MARAHKKFLFVLTSHTKLGDTGEKTGFHFSEMSLPYFMLEDNGVDVTLASIKGGEAPADPKSLKQAEEDGEESVARFLEDSEAHEKLKNTFDLEHISADEYEGIYMPGGHGAMWDFPENKDLKNLIETFWAQGKIVASVCHGPAALVSVMDEDGFPIVRNKLVNCFTNEEEKAIGKDKAMPFALETKLRELGALFQHADNFEGFAIEDGRLITGQNPESAEKVARAIIRCLGLTVQDKEEAA